MKLPFWATFLTLLGLCILCALGTWQIQRLTWKNDLISRLDAAYESSASTALDLDNINQDYVYGRIKGRFMPDNALLLGPRTQDKKIGHDLIVPLKTGNRTLLINMGWSDWPLGEMPIHHLQNRNVWFDGMIITPGWNSFTPPNEPDKNMWYRLDVKEIAETKQISDPYPFILRAEHASHKFDAAFPNNKRIYPKNNHLQYAIFWFAMAAALLTIYMLRFVIGNKKAG